ncbi:MAG: SLC13/DASS family transporter [Alphaproteobacteria bacterium]|nr:SLC13/DASS family transporter [Alphaproteobacteria bacterium]MCB9695256.1 SLC13/DASS family transporter [Alphaproteobacteria bacterium]
MEDTTRSDATRRGVLAGAGALVALGVGALPWSDPKTGRMAALAVWMAWWWVTEVVPIPVTSLLPLVAMPLLGLGTADEVARSYGKPTIFLFLGGFVLALGLQRSGLHRRVALHIVRRVGSTPPRLVLGFMLGSALLSMWLSNTAAVMVMLPIALSILEEAQVRGVTADVRAALGTSLMLGIAYAADIGGMSTPVGTPPNLVLLDLQRQLLPDLPPIGFGQWMLFGLPLSVTFLASGWWLLANVLFRTTRESVFGGGASIERELQALGPVRRDERVAGAVFGVTAIAWMTGADLRLTETLVLHGWRTLTGLHLDDAGIALAASGALFLLPSRDRPGEALMDWATARQVPWGVLLLFGGGFALAQGFQSSGLSALIGSELAGLAGVPEVGLTALVTLVITFLTEFTSNTATATLVLPILADAAGPLHVDPRALMIPATLAASCAFMMPVASPTQAIVFGSGHVSIRQMVRAGLWFNLLGIVLVTLLYATLGRWVFGG